MVNILLLVSCAISARRISSSLQQVVLGEAHHDPINRCQVIMNKISNDSGVGTR
jgi:hypothetical protein